MWPLVSVTVEPKAKDGWEALAETLAQMMAEDPTFSTSIDPESGQCRLHGQDEADLERKLETLISKVGKGLLIGAPQVAYREILTRPAEIDFTYKKALGPKSHFARIKLLVAPGEPGSGFVFESAIFSGALPDEYIPGVIEGLESAKESGLLAGFPLIDFKVSLIDGAHHEVDSSPLAFEIAARGAFKALKDRCGPCLVEPIMKVEVVAPEDCLDAVIADLGRRRAVITGEAPRENAIVARASVPLAALFGYVNRLRAMSQGRAQVSMTLDRYAPVNPPSPPDDLFPSDIGMRA